MATFNEEMVLSCPFGRWDLAVIVKIQRDGKNAALGEAVKRGPTLMEIGDRRVIADLVRTEPFDERAFYNSVHPIDGHPDG